MEFQTLISLDSLVLILLSCLSPVHLLLIIAFTSLNWLASLQTILLSLAYLAFIREP